MSEKTLVIIKPHAFERGLSGEFISRFERCGLTISRAEILSKSPGSWDRFYPSDDAWLKNVGGKTLEDCKTRGVDVGSRLGTSDAREIGQMVKSWLVEHMASGPSFALVFEGNEAQSKARKICGKTLPNLADPGTIRFDYSADSPTLANDEKRPVYNLVHASDPEEFRDGVPAAEYEIRTIFGE